MLRLTAVTILMTIILSRLTLASPNLGRKQIPNTRRYLNLRQFASEGEYQGCPIPLKACAMLSSNKPNEYASISKRGTMNRNWECLNLNTDVNSCGSCDNDCMEIANVARAECVSGSCRIVSCQTGFRPKFVKDGKTGVKELQCA